VIRLNGHNNSEKKHLPSINLKPHPEVINTQPRALIFGYGWVGSSMKKYFTGADIFSVEFGLYIDDLDQIISRTEIEQFIGERSWELGIICVPTPELETGGCDTSIVEEIISEWKDRIKIFIIRSTVEIGTTNQLKLKYNIRIVICPEFIGETIHHPLTKHDSGASIIVGGSPDDTSIVVQYWKTVLNSNAVIRQVDAKTAEMCKYMENCFLATKVTFCNEFYDIAEACDVDYDELRELWLLDPRITRSHTFVYENNRGFGGKCLPKDMKALIHSAREKGSPALLMEFILEKNSQYRLSSRNND